MIKSNFIKIIFLLFLGALCAYPRISYAQGEGVAGNCAKEDHDKIVENTKQSMQRAVDTLKRYASQFNKIADKYLNECKKPTEITKPISQDAATVAAAHKIDYQNEEIWRNTGYDWAGEEPPADKPNCKYLLNDVHGAFPMFMYRKNEAEAAINRAKIYKNRDVCICSAQKDLDAINICMTKAKEELAKDASTCKDFTTYQDEFGKRCILCDIFKVILNVISQVSRIAWDVAAEPLSEVVKIIFLILLAIEVLKAVAAVAGSKITALAKGVLVLSAKVAFTVLLLSESTYIYKYFLSPVLEGGLEMGIAIATASGPGGQCAESTNQKSGIQSSTFTTSLYDTVLSTVDCFGKSAAVMPAIGRGLTCNAWKDTNYGVPNLTMWFSGAIMYVLGVMIWLAISFYMIDCTVQIGMLGGLVPLLIACWPFKLTETYTFKGCKMLMNSFFTYAMVGIVLLIGTTITSFAVGGGDIQKLESAINENDIDTLRELCDFGAVQILILIASAIFAMKLIGQTGDLADQFSKGSGSDIGKKLGGTAASMATGMAKSGGKTSLKALGGIGKFASDEVGLTAAFNKGKDKITGAWQQRWANAGRNLGLGKFQNKQIGSGLEGKEGGAGGSTKPEDKENQKPEDTQNQNQQNDTPNPNPDNPGGGNDNPNNQSIRDKDGMVTLANGEKVGGLGIATRNPDGGVTFTSKGADGSKSTDSYDKDGNRTVQTFNGNGEMTSNFKQNKDGSSSGFIKREDGSIDSWNDKPGTYKNVGTIQENNTPNEGKEK